MRFRRELCAPVLLFLALACTTVSIAQAQSLDESQAEFTVLPDPIHQQDGKYPDTHVVLFRTGCGKDSDGNWKNRLPLTVTQPASGVYTIQLSGSGPQATGLQHDDCTVAFDLKSTSTDHGAAVVQIAVDGVPYGKGFLHFADPLAGPTPGAPQVDVLWAPISYDVCNKAFGRSVAKKFWCIAVKIGNNSGYQLQIAGVGFSTPFGTANQPYIVKTPNSSYALTRAVAQEGSIDSPRSYVLHGIEATGLLMASSAPYFHSARSSSRFGTASAIVAGPLEAAFNLVWADGSLRQANNLDDQSLRDGRLIPNNTQITTVVFLDQQSVSLDYKRACDHLYGSYEESAPAGQKLVYRQTDTKSIKANIAQQNLNASKLYEQCVAGKTTSGLKEALGDMVLVGDTVQFLQRIVVDQTVHSQEASAAAQVSGVQIAYKTLSITGMNLDKLPKALVVRVDGQTQTANQDSTSTSEAATYTLPKAFPSGTVFAIQPAGTALPVSLTGAISNPNPNIATSVLAGTKLTLTGTYLDLLPSPLSVTVDGTPSSVTLDGSSTATNAIYNFATSQTVDKKFTIPDQLGVKLQGANTGTVVAPPS